MPRGPTDTRKVLFFCLNCNTFKPLVYTNDYCAKCYEFESTGWPEEDTQPY